jgi:hypothetical protein
MALSTNTQTNSNGVGNRAVGKIVTDAGAAAAVTIALGFEPRAFYFINLTDRITDTWLEGMAANTSLHTIAAGTVTLEAVNGVTVVGKNVTLTAVTVLASKTFHWVAEG